MNEDEQESSERTDIVDFVIYIGRISRCVERKYNRRFGSRTIGI